jgi:hypothetical protein
MNRTSAKRAATIKRNSSPVALSAALLAAVALLGAQPLLSSTQQAGRNLVTTSNINNEDVLLTTDQTPSGRTAKGLSASDRLELLELSSRFNFAVDTRSFERLRDVLAPDAVLDHQWGYRKGAGEIIALIRSKEAQEKGVRHQNLNPVIWSIEGGRARVLSYLQAVTVDGPAEGFPALPFVVAHGVQTVEAVKGADGRWRIANMVLEQTSVHTGVMPRGAAREHDAATAAVRARLDKAAGE